jgi:SAM-dependent methyltransferase
MQFGSYWPHDYNARSYARPLHWPQTQVAEDGFRIPPRELWAGYGSDDQAFLAGGREDCEAMAQALADSGAGLQEAGRILDLGCAAGRMTRHVLTMAPQAQVWGADIWATAVFWCQDYLTPPGRFVVTTMLPHLPFEDRSFGLVYCGSLFTHIDDLADTWFAELHRILRPGGHLYFSINDRNAVRIFEGEGDPQAYPRFQERSGGRSGWDRFVADTKASPEYQRFRDGDAYMFTRGRSLNSHVMWDSDVLCDRLVWGYRRCAAIPEAYGHQGVVLLERT